MNLIETLTFIQIKIKEEIVDSKHFKEQCQERCLDLNVIKSLIQTNEILGIVKQGENLYKVWFFYEKHKDLNIIIDITKDRLKFITIFPSYANRRKRK